MENIATEILNYFRGHEIVACILGLIVTSALSYVFRGGGKKLAFFLSPVLRRVRFEKKGIAVRLRADSSQCYVRIGSRQRLVSEMMDGDHGVRPGVIIMHGAPKSGKRMFLEMECSKSSDVYRIECESLFDKDRHVKVDGSSFGAIRELMLGIRFSWIVPRHKVFVVPLSQEYANASDCRVLAERINKALQSLRGEDVTFVLRASGFVSGLADGEGFKVLRLNALVPDECVEFIDDSQWPAGASDMLKKSLLHGFHVGPKVLKSDYDRYLISRELWLNTLGQPISLSHFLEVNAHDTDSFWESRIKIIRDILKDENRIASVLAFSYILSLMANPEGRQRGVDVLKLAKACGLEDKFYELKEIVKQISGYDISANREIDLSNIPIFSCRYEPELLLLRCGNFGDVGRYSFGMLDRVASLLSAQDMQWTHDDFQCAGRNLAQAIVDCRCGGKWRETEDDLWSKNKLGSCEGPQIGSVRKAFDAEFSRLCREHRYLGRLNMLCDAMEPEDVQKALFEYFQKCDIPDEDFLHELLTGLLMGFHCGNLVDSFFIDVGRLRGFLNRKHETELLLAVAIEVKLNHHDEIRTFASVATQKELYDAVEEILLTITTDAGLSARCRALHDVGQLLMNHDEHKNVLRGVYTCLKRNDYSDSEDLSEVVAELILFALDGYEHEDLLAVKSWLSSHVKTDGFVAQRALHRLSVRIAFENPNYSWDSVVPLIMGPLEPRSWDLAGRGFLNNEVITAMCDVDSGIRNHVLMEIVKRLGEWQGKMRRGLFENFFYALPELMLEDESLPSSYAKAWGNLHHDAQLNLQRHCYSYGRWHLFNVAARNVAKVKNVDGEILVLNAILSMSSRICIMNGTVYSDSYKRELSESEALLPRNPPQNPAQLLYVAARMLSNGCASFDVDCPEDDKQCLELAEKYLSRPYLRENKKARDRIRIEPFELAYMLVCVLYVVQYGRPASADYDKWCSALQFIQSYIDSPSGKLDDWQELVSDYIAMDWVNWRKLSSMLAQAC